MRQMSTLTLALFDVAPELIGKEINGNYGVNFSITSTKSMEACTSDVVMSILNTLTVAE